MSVGGIGIIGMGKYIPSKKITSEEVETWTGLPKGAIEERTGIQVRHVVEQESASEISAIASRGALQAANVFSEDLGLILGCTSTPDYLTPAMACKVHQLIGAKKAAAYDLVANCTAIQSRYLNWKDPNSAPYFGDGSGAAVLGRVPQNYGVLASETFTHSAAYEAVRIRGGGSSFPLTAGTIHQGLQFCEINGIEVWKRVV